MTTLTATDARSNLFQLLKETIQGHTTTRISSKEGVVVMLSEEDYESLMETAELMSKKGLLASIKKADKEIKVGKVYSFDQVFKK